MTARSAEDEKDHGSDCWAGSISFRLVQLDLVPDPKLRAAVEIPEIVRNFRCVGAIE